MMVSFLPQLVSGMAFFLLVLGGVLRDDLSCGAVLAGFHVAHQLLVLLAAHSFPARDRRKCAGQEQLQGDDFGQERVGFVSAD
jgi:hypothetical protein